MLSFEGAARHYTKLDSAPRQWRVLFSNDAGHAGHAMTTEATGAAAHMHAEPAQHSPASHQQ